MRGFNTDPARGADTFIPFRNFKLSDDSQLLQCRAYYGNMPNEKYTFPADMEMVIVIGISTLHGDANKLGYRAGISLSTTAYKETQINLDNQILPGSTFRQGFAAMIIQNAKTGDTINVSTTGSQTAYAILKIH